MKIKGSITCLNTSDLCDVQTSWTQTADIYCLDSTDGFYSSGFVINKTLGLSFGGTFVQGQLLDDRKGLFLDLYSPRLIGWTQDIDGTYVDGTYTEPRPYNPISINYGIYNQPDGTNWEPVGYRFRTPLNPRVGHYYANMEAPEDRGLYKIHWVYRKDQSSYSTAVDQQFNVRVWGNDQNVPTYGDQYPPVQVIPSLAVKDLGTSTVFTLFIIGNMPLPLTYQWRKGGANISDSTSFSGTNTNTLTINNITMDEAGYYSCVVSSSVASTSAWLVINLPEEP